MNPIYSSRYQTKPRLAYSNSIVSLRATTGHVIACLRHSHLPYSSMLFASQPPRLFQFLKLQVLWAIGGAYQNRESFIHWMKLTSFIQCIIRSVIHWMKLTSAPAEVSDITHLYCSDKTCTGQKCPCVVAGLSCIDICSCAGECQNPNKPAECEGEVSTDL